MDRIFISLFHPMPLYRAQQHRRTSHSTVNNETVEATAYRGQEHRDNDKEDLGHTAWHGKRRDPGVGLHSPRGVIKAMLILFLLKAVD